MCYSPKNKHSLETKKANRMLYTLHHNMLSVFTGMIICMLRGVFYWSGWKLYEHNFTSKKAFYMKGSDRGLLNSKNVP